MHKRYLHHFNIFGQFCDVAQVAIIHKYISQFLAMGTIMLKVSQITIGPNSSTP
jgi:hypothetical protein